MRLLSMRSELLDTIDRVSSVNIDAKATFWIQNAIDLVYAAITKRERQRTDILTTVQSQQWLNVPSDFGDIIEIKNSSNQKLNFLTPEEFFTRHSAETAESTPKDFTFFNNQFLFNPIPDTAISLSVFYDLDRPNIWVHNLTIAYQASMGDYLQVYLDENGIATGEGKLLFISPTTTDARVWIQTADGHQHEIIIYHDASAASNGVAWYLDEDGTNAWERNFFLSPTKAETVVKTENYRGHHHYLSFIHNPDPTTFPDGANVGVFIDEDLTDRTLRLAFISPTPANGTIELTHAKEGQFPGFLERYHSAVFEFAVARGHAFNKRPEEAKAAAERGTALIAMLTGKPAKADGKISDT